MKRIVVTGLGALTPIGTTAQDFHSAQLASQSGVDSITHFDPEELTCKIAGQVNIDISAHLDRQQQKRMDRFAQFAVIAADEAIADSGLDLNSENLERIGTFVGCGMGGMATYEENALISFNRSPMRITPFFIPKIIGNLGAGQIAMKHGFMGASLDTVTACSSGADAIGQAMRAMQHGEIDVAVTGGTEAAITPLCVGAFAVLKALSTRNDDPTGASRPFSEDRDGFVMGEGAGLLVIETLEHAQARGAKIYAELAGYGRSTDAYHLTDPHPQGKGVILAMNHALKEAKLNASDIGYINAHATSTPAGDIAESKALQCVFGTQTPISATKSMTGHLLGAAGAIEAIATIQALDSGVLPPTINLHNQDSALTLDFIPNEAREQQVTHALSNSFGFGGHNAALVFSKI